MERERVSLAGEDLRGEEGYREPEIETLKRIKNPLPWQLGNLKLGSVLGHVSGLLEARSGVVESGVLLKYGASLVDYLGRNSSLNGEIVRGMKLVVGELRRRKEPGANDLICRAWKRSVQTFVVDPALTVFLGNASPSVLERVVFGLVEDSRSRNYCEVLGSESAEFFRRVTSILNEILIRSEGHETVLGLIASFVGGVMSICQKEKKNYLALYPAHCRRLVSLLFISPEVYPTSGEESTVTRGAVFALVRDMYASDRKCALMLLSHYQDWIHPFKDNINACF